MDYLSQKPAVVMLMQTDIKIFQKNFTCCTHDNMSATGVPPHILHNIRMEKMESKIETLNDKICEQLNNLQDNYRTSLP